jgi:voltage-gated potassium channel
MISRQGLRTLVEENDTPQGRVFDLAIQSLIVLSLASYSVSTLPDLSAEMQRYLDFFEASCIAIFTVEYVLRLIVARRPIRFIFSVYGLIDILSILPFYFGIYTGKGLDLRYIRIIRLLRLFRTLKLVRYSNALDRFRQALAMVREELILFGSVALIAIYLSAVGIYLFENEAQPETFRSVFDGLWWAVATLTTVGYGDVFPVTVGGRLFTFAVLIVGLAIVAVPTGLLASALAKTRIGGITPA